MDLEECSFGSVVQQCFIKWLFLQSYFIIVDSIVEKTRVCYFLGQICVWWGILEDMIE